jgi:hypothetical protein
MGPQGSAGPSGTSVVFRARLDPHVTISSPDSRTFDLGTWTQGATEADTFAGTITATPFELVVPVELFLVFVVERPHLVLVVELDPVAPPAFIRIRLEETRFPSLPHDLDAHPPVPTA